MIEKLKHLKKKEIIECEEINFKKIGIPNNENERVIQIIEVNGCLTLLNEIG